MLLVMALLLALSAGIGGAVRRARESATPERAVTYRPMQVEEDGYVSSRRCKACHPSQYASWYGSYHRTMTQVATPDAVRADFDGVTVSGVQDHPMSLERRGREFWAEFDDPDWNGQAKPAPHPEAGRDDYRIASAAGVLVSNRVRTACSGSFPACISSPSVAGSLGAPRSCGRPPEHGSRRPAGWNAVCINCHATNGKRRARRDPAARADRDARGRHDGRGVRHRVRGVSWPGGEHVRANRNPLRRYRLHLTGDRDPTIVQPTRLTARLSSQVCGQCHGIWHPLRSRRRTTAPTPAAPPYRPGSDLARTRFVAQPTETSTRRLMRTSWTSDPAALPDSFWSDGMFASPDGNTTGSSTRRVSRTPRRAATLSCFSCHTMHKTADDPRSIAEWADTHQVSAGHERQRGCLQCHPALRADLTAHTKHRAGSAGSSCYNCHMPYTTYGLLRALRSHQISSPTVARAWRPADRMPATCAISTRRWRGRPSISSNGTGRRRQR